ncbi:MAG: IMS domain-containing protein [Hormoscilla sp.]
MRIPLDYYRILGLPIQATVEQLEMAHRDRTMQLPRREYSEIAISSRKQLLDKAYEVLSDSDQRSTYDASFLSVTPKIDTTSGGEARDNEPPQHSPSIEISESQLVGALLLLLELGEYELVLDLGRPHLSSSKIGEVNNQETTLQLERSDTVLTVALACLELGREQWQQGNYTSAAEYLETGQKFLLTEGLFPTVRGEITSDIYKLRPYRILELLAQSEENTAISAPAPGSTRSQGIQMLRDMLEERGGIDGTGDDGSGLGIDDFLRFVQQLRGYMTSEEQQTLFESEALRPSAVATYLAVYALLARGFAQHKPALITRAKRMLMRLGNRQDVHLEQAVCALLLGQTSEASRALEMSQEYEQIAFIREHSQGAPDLLPGLCLYGERWLHEEVFTHFRDLQNCRTTLKDYFADREVQSYLEALPQEINNSSEWTVVQHQQIPQISATSEGLGPGSNAMGAKGGVVDRGTAPVAAPTMVVKTPSTATLSRSADGTAVIESAKTGDRSLGTGNERASGPSNSSGTIDGLHSSRLSRLSPNRSHAPSTRKDAKPPAIETGREFYSPRFRLWLLVGVSLVLISCLLGWWLLKRIFSPQLALEGEQLLLRLDRSPIEIPDPNTKPQITTGPINQSMAALVLDRWLTIKRQVFGPNHSIEQLEQILTEPALGVQRRRALVARQENWYGQYQHRVTVEEVSLIDRDRAIVEAIVSEKADFFVNGQLERASSYFDPNLRVRYELINQGGQWRINNIILLDN